ncbi:ABC transporter ATP-binding protein [Actinomadura sp. 7K507]|uniref:ABC transporter ATP-binding protein n=1 Tax=Actinomadura sp. 7K507 TaxID=2530365 RepID=UPI001FB58133|nr:ABC transporter ATP-binding protein [Actinomadura sp. 7K507]
MNSTDIDMIGAGVDDAVRMEKVSKVYGRGRGAVAALREVTTAVRRGRFTAVMGPSGSGKSTFLHCAAGLDTPTSGKVRLGDTDLSSMNETKLTELRRERVGFVFQAFNLVSSLTVEQNITLPLRLSRTGVDKAWLAEVIARVGLADRAGHRPAQLSGGQQQRVAIARALVTRPEVVFGDEPTGALDTMTARDVLALLREAVDAMGQTVVMVTHDPVAASYADTVLFLADGRIVDRMNAPSSDKVAARMTRLGAWK